MHKKVVRTIMRNEPHITWPKADFSRVPYGIYHDPEVYEAEQERIFRGPTWNYLALEVEIPAPGDFITTSVGETPVLVHRDKQGAVRAFINRCMHRGTVLRRERRGHAKAHTCVYHQWSYNLEGQLVGVPFAKGVDGVGGMADDFDRSCIRLRSLNVAVFKGVVFGTFVDDAEPLEDYLGPAVRHEIERLFHKPIRVLGYQRQRIFGNWKLYNDNVRDPNHGGLLHMFHATFGLYRLSQVGGAKMDARHRHNITYNSLGQDNDAAREEGYEGTTKVLEKGFRLHDMSLLQYKPEYPDDITLVILSVFPNVVFQQITNSICTRQIRTMGPGEMELYWTYFGYADDDAEMTHHRLKQANLVGPAGLISMEDGEAVEIVQRGVKREQREHAMLEVGGTGAIEDQRSLVTEVPIRGFMSYYCDLMGFQAGNGAA